VDRQAASDRELVRAAQQLEVRGRSEVHAAEAVPDHRRVGRRADRHDQIVEPHGGLQRTARADADQDPGAVALEELVGIDPERRHAHPGALHRDPLAPVDSRIAELVAQLVVQHGAVQVALGDELRAQRITRQQDDGGDVTWLGFEM
jgi:hypothetical protein